MALDAAQVDRGPAEAARTVPILVLTILVFFVHKPLHLEPATVALAGAAVMLLVTRQSLHDVDRRRSSGRRCSSSSACS